MTRQDVLEGNKLCAEFLGAECISPKTKYSYFDFGEDWNTDFPFLFQQTVHSNLLQFHSDWNWLMGVVEKIEQLRHTTNYSHDMRLLWIEISGCLLRCRKEATFKAVVDFIKWYNVTNR